MPEAIGPYSVGTPIGQGGMGEVYRGHDGRLDRPVALKRIKAEAEVSELVRERFKREARTLARVRHPAVVEVYDWVERDDGDWIVMELLEGRSLRFLVEEGPLETRRAVEIGRDIADGLAAVHAHGIVHRDLKPDNIMLVPPGPESTPSLRASAGRTSAGRIKILDFGLAKRVSSMDGVTLTETISKQGQILGTVRFMSPEQAAGRSVDPRSDLFSLGVLLYEMLTGVSPFGGDNAVETLTRICTEAETPIHQLAPSVPESVSDLVRWMLRKEPGRRPQSAAEVTQALDRLAAGLASGRADAELQTTLPSSGSVADVTSATRTAEGATLDKWPTPAATNAPEGPRSMPHGRSWMKAVAASLLAAGAIGLALFFIDTGAEPIEIAVRAPEIGAMNSDVADGEMVASALRAAWTRTLLVLENVSVTASDQVDAVEGTSLEVTRALAVDEVLTSRIDCTGALCQVSLDRVLATGDITWGSSFSVSIEDDFLRLDNAATQTLRRGFSQRPVREGAADLEVRAQDYTAYFRLLNRWKKDANAEEVLPDLRKLQQTSPRFLDAYILLVDVMIYRFAVTHDPEDLEAAFAAARRAHELDPTNQLPLFSLIRVAVNGRRFEDWEEALTKLEELAPGSPRILAKRALLLERQGKQEEALALLRQAATLRPSFDVLHNLAETEYRQNLIADAQQHLLEALELHPGNFVVKTTLAQLELLNGDPREAAALYEEIVEYEGGIGAVINLGLAYLLLERYEDAVAAFYRAAEKIPDSPIILLNLADAELLLGHEAEAMARYRRILELLENGPTAGDWQGLTVRAQALVHLGDFDSAVAAVQEAIRLAPEHPQVAYESALVYAVAGEAASAMASAERAFDGGIQPRWFSFPWFDALRDRPRFKEMTSTDATP